MNARYAMYNLHFQRHQNVQPIFIYTTTTKIYTFLHIFILSFSVGFTVRAAFSAAADFAKLEWKLYKYESKKKNNMQNRRHKWWSLINYKDIF